jgi:hypothetical protein
LRGAAPAAYQVLCSGNGVNQYFIGDVEVRRPLPRNLLFRLHTTQYNDTPTTVNKTARTKAAGPGTAAEPITAREMMIGPEQTRGVHMHKAKMQSATPETAW